LNTPEFGRHAGDGRIVIDATTWGYGAWAAIWLP